MASSLTLGFGFVRSDAKLSFNFGIRMMERNFTADLLCTFLLTQVPTSGSLCKKKNVSTKQKFDFPAHGSFIVDVTSKRDYIIHIDYRSVCTFVGIGSPHPPLPLGSVSPPADPKGGSNTRLQVRGWGNQIRRTGILCVSQCSA